MSYQIYRNKTASRAEFAAGVEFFKQVEREDKALGNGAQSNLNTDTYVAGPLHPRMEDAVYHFHKLLRQSLHTHREAEAAQGKEIWPARRTQEEENLQLSEDRLFCQNVCNTPLDDRESGQRELLAW